MRTLIPSLLISMGLAAGAHGASDAPGADKPDLAAVRAAETRIDAADLLRQIRVLASDAFEGRAPGSRGERLSVAYIEREFRQLGLEPGSRDGRYVQPVPMVGITTAPALTVHVGGKATTLAFPADYVAWSARPVARTVVDTSELVFVGYGVQAPEYGWDDFKGVDLRGKTLVMLINDPAIPDPNDPTRLDPQMFKGREMTYYGRWTYKFEMAAQLGAAAAIIVHDTAAAGYPFDVVRHTWAHENLDLRGSTPRFPPVTGWIQHERARALFESAGFDLAALERAALSKDFKPVALGIQASFDARNRMRTLESRNVVARIPGSDPALRDEAIVYTAHWDHLGIDRSLPGPKTRQIYHGALDNAAGVAALFDIARAYQALAVKPKRTIVFVATTAEEQGLLGARYYVEHPVVPLDRTLMDVNIDVVNFYGRTKDLRIIGAGKSDIDDRVIRDAALHGRTAPPDANPELGSFFRADQFEFAKAGVPVLFLKAGTQVLGRPDDYGNEAKREYVAHRYHTVDDIVDDRWDLSGAVEDTQLLFRLGLEVAQGSSRPQWRPDSEFGRPGDADPYRWLEQVDGPAAMRWVRAENAKTLATLDADPRFADFQARALAVEQSGDRIPFAQRIDGGLWNFWQDASHVRGVWRVSAHESYDSGGPPAWETALDLDSLAAAEHVGWTWKGAQCNAGQESRCLVALSDGGEDATTVREYDLRERRFVAGGFDLPRSKQSAVWEDADTVIVAREWAPGELTSSGYPYVVRRLHRGQPLAAAVEIFRGSASDARLKLRALADAPGHRVVLVQRGLSFFDWQTSLLTDTGVATLNLPAKARVVALFDGQLIVKIDEAWPAAGPRFTPGALVAIDLKQALATPAALRPVLILAPTDRQSIEEVASTRAGLLVTLLDQVRGRASVFARAADGSWSATPLALPTGTAVKIGDASPQSATAYLTLAGYLQPQSQWRVDGTAARELRTLPAQFDASQQVVEQFEARSSDGTAIPYTVVHRQGMALDGSHPTILHAYGGFGVSVLPDYDGALGRLWLERGGVYVVANIRGGGEFGPAWHEAGLKTKRQSVYDDFAAVGRDLVARGITSPRRLGIMGGSNGGLLMGVEMTQHPELWGAVDIEVPLLDMLRYEHIAAGALWVGEYGSASNPAERAFLAKISPYENLRRGVAYPRPLVWTTSKDDRVGPQHARKFAARLAEYGIPYYFYEFTEGGHSADANLQELARTDAMEYLYFARALMDP